MARPAHAAGRPVHSQGRLGTCLPRAGRREHRRPPTSGRACPIVCSSTTGGADALVSPSSSSRGGNSTCPSWAAAAIPAAMAATGPKCSLRARSTSPPSPPESRGSWAIGRNGSRTRSSSTIRRGGSIFRPAIGRLLAQLQDLARACWRLFGLRGYARVDFRVDRDIGRGFWR